MIFKYMIQAALVAMLAVAVSACTPGGGQSSDSQGVPTVPPTKVPATDPPVQEPTPASPGKVGRANVESLDIRILESFPVQIHVTIKGNVSDSCTTASPIEQEREGDTFRITVGATRPSGAMCAQVITPFEQSVALDVAGLKAGIYTVEANGVTGTFELTADNVLR